MLAGYLFAAEKWGKFADDWKHVLDQNPRIKYFKMQEAVSGEGQFFGVPIEFRKLKARELLSVLRTHDPDGLHVDLSWEHWRKFEQKLPEQMRSPYTPLFFGILDTIMAYQKNMGRFPEKCELDFDEQGEAGLFAIEWYKRMQPHFPDEYKQILGRSPTMLSDIDYMPLQAADMFAWSLRRRLDPDDSLRKDWDWIHQELHMTSWGGHGFTEESWDALSIMLGI